MGGTTVLFEIIILLNIAFVQPGGISKNYGNIARKRLPLAEGDNSITLPVI